MEPCAIGDGVARSPPNVQPTAIPPAMTPHLRSAYLSARFASILVVGFTCTSLASAQESQGAQFDTRDAARMLVRSADTNLDGSVSTEERDQFLVAYATPAADQGLLNRDALLAQSLRGFYDADGDQTFSQGDLDALFARLDVDQSGDLSVQERTGGQRGARLLDGVVLNALDVNLDQAVSAEEWAASKSLDLTAWIGTTAAIQEDINGFGPGTMILTLRSSLDANRDSRFDREDVVQIFSVLDANSDGTVDAAELAPAQRRRAAPSRQYTSEELARSPAMPWQRNLEDALALSKQTGKPLLVCVNADGESASDRLASGQYADPEFVELVRGFIPVLASPFPHTNGSAGPRGERLECPRFGHLVCTEHINGEPELHRLYFSDQRVAPRHVGVSPQGEILFDLYLLQDLGVIGRTLQKHGKYDTQLPDPTEASDQELWNSQDAAFRRELRKRFAAGNVEVRTAFVNWAFSRQRAVQHPEILSLGLYDSSAAVRKAAAEHAIDSMTLETVDQAPRVRWIAANDGALRQKLIVRLWMLADATEETSGTIRARRLARVYSALEGDSPLDAQRWRSNLAGAPLLTANSSPSDGAALELALEQVSALLSEAPNDPELNGILAQTALRMAMRAISGEGGGSPQYLLQDAEVAAQRVLEIRPGDVLALSVLARAQWWSSKAEEAANNAAAVLPSCAPLAASPVTAELLDILAKGRENTLKPALGTKAGWPKTWLTEAVAARRIQIALPSVSVEQVIAGISLLGELEDYRAQAELISFGIKRFPTSNDLHAWLRWQILRDGSDSLTRAGALEAAYQELETPDGVEPTWLWYKGLGLRTAGDTYVEQGDLEKAAAAYAASIDSFEQSITWNASFADSANEHILQARASLEAL